MGTTTETTDPEPAERGGLVARVRRVVEWVLSTKPARAFLLYQERHGAMLADSVTYRTLFSVFAGVFLGFAIAGIWLAGDDAAMDALVAAVDQAIPGLVGTDGLIDPDDLVQPLTLSIAGAIALVGLVGAAIGAIGSLRLAFRELGGLPDDQTFFLWVLLRNLAIAIGFGALLAASAAVTVFSTSAVTLVLGWLGIGRGDPFSGFTTQAVSILITFVIDTVAVAGVFRLLSGQRPNARELWVGAALGGIGLTVLQVLSGLFVGGASSNPLLASFGALVALLIWFNFSAQVILIAGAYIITSIDERRDRVAERYGARSMALRRLKRAERRAQDAAAEVIAARDALEPRTRR
ncbi:YihY/virulence factor BrkB family protein [Agromyces sp. CFH 90414]|uniref:YihY/virulence factor BrkB family protein n=1 Tax=Agromyces agglutinans TaxID=2662258 RepID=A0A6I2FGJ5_9MICO|nr:YihY/virulence factor BrkB family protein [Agromyces agglutinans]MRG61790.1 YihY/virulence factor BrkB family protein [Agromyces agglutinans]